MGCIKNTASNVQLGTSGIAQKCRVRDWHIQAEKEINAGLSLELCVSIRKQIHSEMNNLKDGSDMTNATADEEDSMICVV